MNQGYTDTGTVRPPNYTRSVCLAMKVLREAKITDFPVNLTRLLRRFGIRLFSYEQFCEATGFSMEACIRCHGKDGAAIELPAGNYLIVYNNNLKPPERLRFTIAHELGHIFLGHFAEGDVSTIRRDTVGKPLYLVMEKEANCFARNLLTPPRAAMELLRMHGLIAMTFDEKQNRNVWQKVSGAPCLPGMSKSIEDFELIKRAFNLTNKGAKTRCDFLNTDLLHLKPEDRKPAYPFTFAAKWRCARCGAPLQEGSAYCYHCGIRNRITFSVWPDAPELPATAEYSGSFFSACNFCGSPRKSDYGWFCTQCGNLLANPCVPSRMRVDKRPDVLTLEHLQKRHRCSPGALYCPDCGSQTLFAQLAPEIPNSGIPGNSPAAAAEPRAEKNAGTAKSKVRDPMKTDQNQRLLRCRYCGRGKHEDDAKFCTVCGKPLVNACPRCLSERDSDDRYCRICGRETLFFREGFLPPLGEEGPETVEYHAPSAPPKGFYTTPDSHGSYVFLNGFRGTKDRDKPWNCPLCGTKNSRGEITCRYCGLPFMNGCAACEYDAKKTDNFCRNCGSMTAYFRGAVSDPEERKLARKNSKEEIAYWRQYGIRYLYARKIEDYEEEIRLYGEIESEP